jgi:hypothetical protein
VFPWRRELHVSEEVAMLSKHDTSLDPSAHFVGGSSCAPAAVGDSLYSPQRPARGGRAGPLFGTSDQPGLDAHGNVSTRLAALPHYPYNSSGGRVVLSAAIVLPAGMGMRHPASYAGDKFSGQVCEYLALWRNCSDAQAKRALGEQVDALWRRHLCFRAWAKAVYGLNRRRVGALAHSSLQKLT